MGNSNRVDISAVLPMMDGEDPVEWTEKALELSKEYGTYRQCSIDWHDECSQASMGSDAECMCLCHEDGVELYTVGGDTADGRLKVTKSALGTEYWPPVVGEPEGSWAHWLYAKGFSTAERNGLDIQKRLMEREREV